MNHSENSHVPLWLRCYHTNSDFVRSSAPWSSTTLNTAIFSYRSLSNGVPNFFSTIENEIHFREILFHVCVTKIFMRPLILFLFCQFSFYLYEGGGWWTLAKEWNHTGRKLRKIPVESRIQPGGVWVVMGLSPQRICTLQRATCGMMIKQKCTNAN